MAERFGDRGAVLDEGVGDDADGVQGPREPRSYCTVWVIGDLRTAVPRSRGERGPRGDPLASASRATACRPCTHARRAPRSTSAPAVDRRGLRESPRSPEDLAPRRPGLADPTITVASRGSGGLGAGRALPERYRVPVLPTTFGIRHVATTTGRIDHSRGVADPRAAADAGRTPGGRQSPPVLVAAETVRRARDPIWLPCAVTDRSQASAVEHARAHLADATPRRLRLVADSSTGTRDRQRGTGPAASRTGSTTARDSDAPAGATSHGALETGPVRDARRIAWTGGAVFVLDVDRGPFPS